MRIDMIYYPTDFFAEPPEGVDVEASGRTFAALVTTSLSQEFPGARINVWYNPTAVRSADEFEIHWEDGEIASDVRKVEERRIRDRVAMVVGEVRSARDWIVRVLE
jgi:hypothetical protein